MKTKLYETFSLKSLSDQLACYSDDDLLNNRPLRTYKYQIY